MKNATVHVHITPQTPKRMNAGRYTQTNIVKQRGNRKSSKRKMTPYIQRNLTKPNSYFSSEIMKTGRWWGDVFQMLNIKIKVKISTYNLISSKAVFQDFLLSASSKYMNI